MTTTTTSRVTLPPFAQQLYVHQVQPGDVLLIGNLVPFTVHLSGPGSGRSWVLSGRIPADHPHYGEGSELTLEMERDHRLVVRRPMPETT